jgi:tryptophanase
MKTIIEPFKIKVVEPIPFQSRTARERILKKAGLNLFAVRAEDIMIDLLTDSGTSAMSSRQWAGVMDGDESYAGSRSFYRFESVVGELTGYRHIIPTHQGRAAERILFSIVDVKGRSIPNNNHFDTTRANIEYQGGTAVDLVIDEGKIPDRIHPFKGNIDTQKLKHLIEEKGAENIPLCMITITNNSGGGQPVSLANIHGVKEMLSRYGIPLFLDACRFAENAYFIKKREGENGDRTVRDIAEEVFRIADGCTMSAKKDGLANIGGFLALNSDEWAEKARSLLILTEGFPTYGGLAGRDLEGVAQGLMEVVDEEYLKYRIRSVEYLGEKLTSLGIPIIQPPGGHAIYVDAKTLLPHIPSAQFPGQALALEIYLAGGIRTVEIGSVMFGKLDPVTKQFVPPAMELVRFAIPRRVYTQSHIDYIIEVMEELYRTRDSIKGVKITKEPPFLRHFTASFDWA